MSIQSTGTASIKDWPLDDRPREKLLYKGKAALSDAELLAILIGSGNRHLNAVDLCRKILTDAQNSLKSLSELSVEELTQYDGIGEAKAVSIITGLELGRRRQLENAKDIKKITCSNDVFKHLHPIIGDLKHEEFWAIYLDNASKILHQLPISKGGITSAVVDNKMLLKKAVELLATGIIICHNHPSGEVNPSTADKEITQKLKEGARLLDIQLLDHVILTEKLYFSFADSNLL